MSRPTDPANLDRPAVDSAMAVLTDHWTVPVPAAIAHDAIAGDGCCRDLAAHDLAGILGTDVPA